MRGEKLDILKETVTFMLSQLGPTDYAGVVSFGRHITTDCELSAMNASGKKHAKQAVRNLQAGSETNLSGGLLRGLDELASADVQKDGVNAAVLLLTDGLQNVGMRNKDDIVHAMQQSIGTQQLQYNSISVYTFGLGRDLDTNLLFTLATATNGCYYKIADTSSIAPAFADCFVTLKRIIAQNAQLLIDAEAGASIVRVHTPCPVTPSSAVQCDGSHPLEAAEAITEASVTMGNLKIEEKRDILVSVHLPFEEPVLRHTLTCTLRYTHAHTGEVLHETCDLMVVRGDGGKLVDHEVEAGRIKVVVAKALDDAAACSDIEAATRCLDAAKQEVSASVITDDEEGQHAMRELNTCADGLIAQTQAALPAGANPWQNNASVVPPTAADMTVDASSLRKGNIVMHQERPCRIIHIQTSKTGKHGHAKSLLTMDCITTGKRVETVIPTGHNVTLCKDPHAVAPTHAYEDGKSLSKGDMVVVELRLIDISSDGFMVLMDSAGSVHEHLRLPCGTLGSTISSAHGASESDVWVALLQMNGREEVMSARIAADRQ